MKAKDRKIARIKFLARIEAVDPGLAEELQEMWAEEEARPVPPSGGADRDV
jgi:hypothetical protein